MNTIVIDSEKCTRDGICIAECPFLLFAEGEGGVPYLVEGAGERCLDCGHCVAVCPAKAITLNGVGADDCEEVNSALSLTPEQVTQFFRSRRSIRTYREKPVDRSTLESLLDIARWAPSARNAQPVSWIVINNKEQVYDLSRMTIDWFKRKNMLPDVVKDFELGQDMIHRGAPCLIIAHAASTAIKPAEDCSIAITTIEAAAPVYALGSCWAGFFMGAAKEDEAIRSFLDLPEGNQVYAALMIGHPKYRYNRIPPRAEAKVEWR